MPLFYHLGGDALEHDLWAGEISRGNWLGNERFYVAPLYPYFLGLLYTLFGHDLLLVRFVQIALGATSCVFLALAGNALFSWGVGLFAGFLLALYPITIFFEGLIQKSVLEIFFLALLLFLLGRTLLNPKKRTWVFIGLVTALLALTRENAFILPWIFAVWIFVRFRTAPLKQRVAWCGALLIGLGIVLLPVGLRNLAVGGEFHMGSTQFGPIFFLSNNKDADGIYTPFRLARGNAEFERRDTAELAEKALGRKLTPKEVSEYWTRRTLADIKEDPGRWARLLIRKWCLVWNAAEISDTEDFYTYQKWSMFLRGMGFFNFGVIAPLGIFGIYVTWPQRRQLWILYLMELGFSVGLTLYLVSSRYRLPLVPCLILFAAAGVIEGFQGLRKKRFLTVAIGCLIALVAAIAIHQNIVPRDRFRATGAYNLGVALIEQNKFKEATGYLEEARRLNPDDVSIVNNLGSVLARQGKFSEAIAAFTQAIRLRPDHVGAHYNLGLAFMETQQLEESAAQLAEAVRLDPNYNRAHYWLGIVLTKLGKPEEAAPHLEIARNAGLPPPKDRNKEGFQSTAGP